MSDERTRWILALVVWLSVAIPGCCCIGPTATPTPHLTATPTTEVATGTPTPTETAPPPSGAGLLDDLPRELQLVVASPMLLQEPPPVKLPAARLVWQATDCYALRLWGFPFDEVVHVDLYDPTGQFVAAHEEAHELGQPDRGLKEVHLFLGGRPAGDWTIAVGSAGVSMRTPLHVDEPPRPQMSIAREGVAPVTTWRECVGGIYARVDQIALFGAGFPSARTLPLGIYEWREHHGARSLYDLVYLQEVRTDDEGRFEVHRAVQALVPEGGGSYLAIVVLDPSAPYDTAPRAGFSVKPDISTPSEEATLELAVDGGAFADTTVQRAVLAAVNRSYLSDYFDGAPVTFLFSSSGRALDASGEPWDPDLAHQLLAEAGYPDGVPARFLYPDGDVELAGVAQGMARDLVQVGISAELVAMPRSDLGSYASTLAAAGMPVIWLTRR